jgi:hypothetical protein
MFILFSQPNSSPAFNKSGKIVYHVPGSRHNNNRSITIIFNPPDGDAGKILSAAPSGHRIEPANLFLKLLHSYAFVYAITNQILL